MKKFKRVIILLPLLGFFIFLVIAFWPFVLINIIEPVLLAAQMFLRSFILVVHQKYYWGILVFVFVVLCCYHLLQREKTASRYTPQDSNATVQRINNWKSYIKFIKNNDGENLFLKKKLIELVFSMYVLKQHIHDDAELYKALRDRRITLPDNIYDFFLFGDGPSVPDSWIVRVLQTIRNTFGGWVSRLMGQDVKKYYESIDDVLAFIESNMEIKNEQ